VETSHEETVETVTTETIQTYEEKQDKGPEYTTIIYQDQGVEEQYYTETIVTDVVTAEDFYATKEVGHKEVYETQPVKPPPQPRIKNKRTVAAVSSEDKRLALQAMEELRSRGATTDDLVCRLCDPPRPFTAYSTLLTHYRSHAGLRPFECSLCGATFTRQHSLNYHLMTHANQTRFTCPHCNRKFRHPTHFKEHVKKHGEVVQFLCNFCPASLSTQSQYRKHIKTKHSKTIDIMGNIIDTAPDGKNGEKGRRKRKTQGTEEVDVTDNRKKRRRRGKDDELTEISQYEEVVQSGVLDGAGTVIYEETITMQESEQMYSENTDYILERVPDNEAYQMIETQEATDSISTMEYVQNSNEQVVEELSPEIIEEIVTTSSDNSVLYQQVHNDNNYQFIAQNEQIIPQTQVEPKSPMIFVVPNDHKKEEVQTIQNTLYSNEPKKPIVISKFQTNQSNKIPNIKQGVFANINGQKVLLIAKKKEENYQVPVATPTSVIQATINNQLQNGNVSKGRSIYLQSASINQGPSEKLIKDTAVKILSNNQTVISSPVTERQNPSNTNGANVYVMPSHAIALTEIDPNKVQNTVNEDNSIPEELVDADKQSNNILEQAMHEVFPSSLVPGEEPAEEVITEEGMNYENNQGDLYNPMRSPLKNRNQILQEVLGMS